MNGEVGDRLPAEVRLPGHLGPTLFTREARGGQLVTLGAFYAALRAHEHAHSFVIGTTRETQGAESRAYAVFCAHPESGQISLVDLDAPHGVCFVNRGVDELAASLAAFSAAWPRLAGMDEPDAQSALEGVRSELAAIDPAALRDEDAFWPTVLDTVI